MILNNKNNVQFLTFEIYKDLDFINHCFSTKIGGVSKDEFSTLNLGFNRGDDRENVINNFKILGNAVNFNPENIIMSSQTHLDKIQYVDESLIGNGFTKPNVLENIDGLITDNKNLVLTTFYADCVPVYFVDKAKQIIALSHSGWKGTVSKISEKTINKMVSEFGSLKEDILIGIGPSICGDCFEVDFPVYEKFREVFSFTDKYTTKKNNKYYISMQKIIKENLTSIGILENNIELPEICTKCNPDLFYSHRNTGNKRGSLAGFLELILKKEGLGGRCPPNLLQGS